MKTAVTVALLALICFECCNSAGPYGTHALFQTLSKCCTNSTRFLIEKGKVRNVANSDCSHAIIVTTVCNKKLCLDGDWKWAKKLQEEFKKSTDNQGRPSAPFNVHNCTKRAGKA